MLDLLLLLGALALGCWVVPALLWKSYGPWFMRQIEDAAAAVRSLNPVKHFDTPRHAPADYVERGESWDPDPEGDRSDRDPSVRIASDRVVRADKKMPADILNLTEDTHAFPWRDVVTLLATIEILDDDGTRKRATIRGIAQAVGKRQEDVTPLVHQARGDAPLPTDDPQAWESVAPGRLIRR